MKGKDEIELEKIVDKIIEKAEFIVKLVMPKSWDVENARPILFKANSEGPDRSVTLDEDEFMAVAASSGDYMTRLNSFAANQSSRGTVTSFENVKKEILSSSTSSVLSVLQIPLSMHKIKKQIETTYVKALYRVAGFKLLGQLSVLNLSSNLRYTYLNWLCSSLRGNVNTLSHFSDNVKGCGEHITKHLRDNFYEIFNGIIEQLKLTTDFTEIKFLIGCLKWQFGADEHEYLVKSKIMNLLKEGNGQDT